MSFKQIFVTTEAFKTYFDVFRGFWVAFGLMLFLGSLSSPALSRSVLDLDASKQPVSLSDWGEFWIDPHSRLAAEQVAINNDAPWAPTKLNGIYPLRPGQVLWIRFTVPPAPDGERWQLEIPYAALDRASLYSLDRAGQWIEQRAGDLTPVNAWPTPHRHTLLLVNVNAEDPSRYLLRIENAQGFSAPIRFINAPYLLRSEQQVSLFLGIYFGLALLGSVVGLFGVLWLKDHAYFYYALCSALVGLTQASITGVAALQLWPNSPDWADRSLGLLATWMLVTLLLLNATVVSLAQRSRPLHILVWLVALAGVALSVLLGLTASAIRLKLIVPYMLLVPVLILLINFWAWRRGDRFAGWLMLSSTPFAFSLALAVARYLEWMSLSFATEQGILASMALELPAILAVLLLRSQHRRESRRRIDGLDRLDPATGLINGPVFGERLARMMARSDRLRHQGAVMLIDIVNSEQTQRDFGRKAADDLPLRVAGRLLSTAREIDSAARISERQFGMLIEGPFTAEDAATLGPRIVARCLMPYKGLHVDCVAQVRVAYALVPFEECSAENILSRLEERLALASPTDKRAVFVLGEAEGFVSRRPDLRRRSSLESS